MRGVFAKTLLAFALANATVGTVMFVLSQSLSDDAGALIISPLLAAQGRAAAALVESGRVEQARALLDNLKRDSGITAYVLDAESHDLLGRDVSSELLEVARASRDDAAPRSKRRIRGGLVATPVDAGRPDLMVTAIVPPPPMHERGRRDYFVSRVALALSAAALVCYGFAAYLVAPVRRLREAVRKIATGDLHARAGQAVGKRGDEIGQLAAEFDRMAAHLEALISEQRSFFRHASHELRSPLARAQVAVGLLRRRQDDPLLQRIELEIERLNRQVDQLLALARLEHGVRETLTQPVDLSRLVAEVTADADFEARGRGAAVALSAAPDVSIVGDEAVLRSVLENVARNAVIHTAEGSTVEIALSLAPASGDQPRSAVIAVRDHGAGVPAELHEAIFEPYKRLRDGEIGGLGLTIARRGCELHGGTVRAANHPDGGFVVTIELPLRHIHP